jgi:hypothetical protein
MVVLGPADFRRGCFFSRSWLKTSGLPGDLRV